MNDSRRERKPLRKVHTLVPRTWADTMLAFWATLLAIFSIPAAAAESLSIFHVGNSLTDQAYGMYDIAEARGYKTKFGRHMIPGAPLDWLWNNRDEGFRDPDGNKPADEILSEAKWDVLIVQPHDRTAEESIEYGAKYATAAYEGNPKCQVFVFASYPGIGEDKSEKDQWEERWLSPDFQQGRATFEKVAKGISAKFPDKKTVGIIPVGEVMYRLHLRMQEGKVPGFKHIEELYEDGVHLNSEGMYVEAVTHYATVFQDDPHNCITSGLRFWERPYRVDKGFAKVVWDVAWEVVSSDSRISVKSASE